MTDIQTATATGAILGGLLGTVLTIAIIFYVLIVIATWKIFSKAGEPGWKSLIPIYNAYIMYKISGMKNWFWITLIVSIVSSIISSMVGATSTVATVISIISAIFYIIVAIVLCYKLAKAFGKGVGYTIGLIFLPNIFTLILGFGRAEYQGAE